MQGLARIRKHYIKEVLFKGRHILYVISNIASPSINWGVVKMAEIRGAAVVSCDDKCGCTVPCSGGTTCR